MASKERNFLCGWRHVDRGLVGPRGVLLAAQRCFFNPIPAALLVTTSSVKARKSQRPSARTLPGRLAPQRHIPRQRPALASL